MWRNVRKRKNVRMSFTCGWTNYTAGFIRILLECRAVTSYVYNVQKMFMFIAFNRFNGILRRFLKILSISLDFLGIIRGQYWRISSSGWDSFGILLGFFWDSELIESSGYGVHRWFNLYWPLARFIVTKRSEHCEIFQQKPTKSNQNSNYFWLFIYFF